MTDESQVSRFLDSQIKLMHPSTNFKKKHPDLSFSPTLKNLQKLAIVHVTKGKEHDWAFCSNRVWKRVTEKQCFNLNTIVSIDTHWCDATYRRLEGTATYVYKLRHLHPILYTRVIQHRSTQTIQHSKTATVQI
jgi:hypothetical protein